MRADTQLAPRGTNVLAFSSEESCLLPSKGLKRCGLMHGGEGQHGTKTEVPAASLKLPHTRDLTPPWPSCYGSISAGNFPLQLLMGHKEKKFSLRTTPVMTRLLVRTGGAVMFLCSTTRSHTAVSSRATSTETETGKNPEISQQLLSHSCVQSGLQTQGLANC